MDLQEGPGHIRGWRCLAQKGLGGGGGESEDGFVFK